MGHKLLLLERILMINKFVKQEIVKEFSRYFFVGLLCAVLDLAFLYFLVEFIHLWYLLAAIISFSLITYGGYFLQRSFTFRNTSENKKKQFTLFIVISVCGLVINTMSMYLFVSIFGIWYVFSNILIKAIVFLWNFLANKYITFNNRI